MKRMLVILLAAAICLGCVACAGGGLPDDTGSADKETVLTVVTSYGGDDGNRTSFVAAVNSYEEHSGIVVLDNSADSNEEWKTKVLTDFMTGSEPDVLFYFTNADADPFINAGKVVSIEEIRQVYPDYATNMKESMMAVASDGLHYAVPSTGFWETMFANKTVLDACGIEVPGPDYTWEQFLADCETIKTAGYTPIACSLYEIPHYWFEFAVMNNGTPEDHLEVPVLDGDGNLADDEVSRKWIAALEDMKDLYDAGCCQQKLTLQTVAECCYVSQWHLSKLLNRHAGKSFYDILNTIRIEKAKALLMDPSLKIGEIAELVGYADTAHFARTFKKLEGMSANEFRNVKR